MIPFLDLHSINKPYEATFKTAFDAVVKNGRYILGEYVRRFETNFAEYCGAKYCLGTANGLDALTLILKGYIQLGILKKGDKVIVPANTFIATVLSVRHAELEPVLVEPHSETYNLDAENVAPYMYDGTIKAIVMVHLYGQLADVEGLQALAKRHSLLLIEDAAQAHGAETIINNNSVKAGNLGDAAAFSFYPTKNLGALGDGGAVTTNNEDLYNAIGLLRNYGSKEKYTYETMGFNSRLDEIQAAFLDCKLPYLDTDNAKRKSVAKRYLNEISNPKITLPFYNNSNNHVFYAFVIQVDNRDVFTSYLDEYRIGWLIHYPIPPHQQDALADLSELQLPITEQVHQRIISLPISPAMTDDDVDIIITTINNY